MSSSVVEVDPRKKFADLARGALLLVVALLGYAVQSDQLHHPAAHPGSAAHPGPAWVQKAARLDARYHCSRSGLQSGVIPARAVVKVGRQVRLTSFDEGWAVHLEQLPGRLISVCAR